MGKGAGEEEAALAHSCLQLVSLACSAAFGAWVTTTTTDVAARHAGNDTATCLEPWQIDSSRRQLDDEAAGPTECVAVSQPSSTELTDRIIRTQANAGAVVRRLPLAMYGRTYCVLLCQLGC
jgi:hypothetical protein